MQRTSGLDKNSSLLINLLFEHVFLLFEHCWVTYYLKLKVYIKVQ